MENHPLDCADIAAEIAAFEQRLTALQLAMRRPLPPDLFRLCQLSVQALEAGLVILTQQQGSPDRD